ncbi:Tspan5 [Lemmus lemmus]
MSGKHYKGPEVSCCIKYFIFGFNVIFWFLGITFLGIGLWAWNEKGVLSNISSITDLGGFDPVWLFLVVGGVMFILGFAGCIGALRENTFLLKFFSVFLGIIFFLELTAGVLAFVFKDWIKDQLYFFINNNIRAYRDDIDLQNLIDFTQEYWQCCGAFGADDWNLNIYFNCTDSNASRERCGVPFSCCTKDPAVRAPSSQWLLCACAHYGQDGSWPDCSSSIGGAVPQASQSRQDGWYSFSKCVCICSYSEPWCVSAHGRSKRGVPFLGQKKKKPNHSMWSTSDFSQITVLTGDRDGCQTQAATSVSCPSFMRMWVCSLIKLCLFT